ncbi:hypothetical protein Tco_0506667 [Tanacetum coccineum]
MALCGPAGQRYSGLFLLKDRWSPWRSLQEVFKGRVFSLTSLKCGTCDMGVETVNHYFSLAALVLPLVESELFRCGMITRRECDMIAITDWGTVDTKSSSSYQEPKDVGGSYYLPLMTTSLDPFDVTSLEISIGIGIWYWNLVLAFGIGIWYWHLAFALAFTLALALEFGIGIGIGIGISIGLRVCFTDCICVWSSALASA